MSWMLRILPGWRWARRWSQALASACPGNDAHASWSPDGEWIAFASGRRGFNDEAPLHPHNGQPYGEIYVMRADGSDVRMLTDSPFETATPTWIR
jgi:TolB protein